MMQPECYIQVILPLKLGWEPWYRTSEDDAVQVGARVRVKFSGREYVGVVSRVGGTPDIDVSRVQGILCVEPRLERISEGEMLFWRFIAAYYLCTVGEVYKFAYPAGRTAVEVKRANKSGIPLESPLQRRLDVADKTAVREILDAFVDRRPVLLSGCGLEPVFAELTRRTLESGRDVLRLRPDAGRASYVRQRESAKAVRGDAPVVVSGGKEHLFLPFAKLGLIIVEEECSVSYKHSSMAPRFHARDAAVALAAQHGADVLLAAATPSLESLLNARSGKFARVSLERTISRVTPVVIDTDDEYRKSGMSGPLSRKLISRLEAVEGRKLVVAPWDLDEPLRYPRLKTVKLAALASEKLDRYDLVALLNAEALLGRNDFRADEKALRLLSDLECRVRGELVIQTRGAGHPIFTTGHREYLETLMKERQDFGFPPFTRMVEVRVADTNEPRRAKMSDLLTRRLGGSLQLFFPKDRTLAERKSSLAAAVAEFEKEYNYPGHIIIDVDP